MANALNTDKQIAIIAALGGRFKHSFHRAYDRRSSGYDHAPGREGRTGMHGADGCQDARPFLQSPGDG